MSPNARASERVDDARSDLLAFDECVYASVSEYSGYVVVVVAACGGEGGERARSESGNGIQDEVVCEVGEEKASEEMVRRSVEICRHRADRV